MKSINKGKKNRTYYAQKYKLKVRPVKRMSAFSLLFCASDSQSFTCYGLMVMVVGISEGSLYVRGAP